MCSACGIPTHVLELDPVAPADEIAAPGPAKFAALRNADSRPYLFGAALAMMADNIEHVITYWMLWQKFHSPPCPASRSSATGCRSCCSPCTSARWPTDTTAAA